MMFLPKVNPMTAVADGHGGLKEHVVGCFHAKYGDINPWLGHRMTKVCVSQLTRPYAHMLKTSVTNKVIRKSMMSK